MSRWYRIAYDYKGEVGWLFTDYEELSMAQEVLESYKAYKKVDPEFYTDYTNFRVQWVDEPEPVELVWQDVIERAPKPMNRKILEQESM